MKINKPLDVPIKRKKDTDTESSLVTLEMKESSQQLEKRNSKSKVSEKESFLKRNEETSDRSFYQSRTRIKIKISNKKVIKEILNNQHRISPKPKRTFHRLTKIPKISTRKQKDCEATYYEVESVLDSRKSKDGFEYFIKWKGYSESESTWEPESNVACKFRKNHLIVYNSNENDQDSTTNEKNIDFCLVCDKNDNLIRCDSCPRSFHLKCIGMKEKDAAGTSSWHCEICQNNKKKQSEDIMKGDISHDIINKVFAPLKISCRGYRKKISILCKIHELVTFLINDEFGRFFSEQIKISLYLKFIKDPKDLTTIAMNLINGTYLQDASLGLSVKSIAMNLINGTYLQDASSTLSRKDINVCNLNENTFDEIILAVLNDIEKVWQNCFVFNEEGSAMYRIGKIMQEKYHTISQRSFYNDLTSGIKKFYNNFVTENQEVECPSHSDNNDSLDLHVEYRNTNSDSLGPLYEAWVKSCNKTL